MNRREEHVLVRKAAEGDRRAIEALIRAHQDSLYAFILRMSGRPETAEDIVQEAFVRVLRNLHRFDDRFRFSTWLFTIGKRLYMNAAQKLGPAYDSATMFTTNRCKANPVLWSQEVVKDGTVRAVVLNSGGANCYTGPDGFQTTHAVAEQVAGEAR